MLAIFGIGLGCNWILTYVDGKAMKHQWLQSEIVDTYWFIHHLITIRSSIDIEHGSLNGVVGDDFIRRIHYYAIIHARCTSI